MERYRLFSRFTVQAGLRGKWPISLFWLRPDIVEAEKLARHLDEVNATILPVVNLYARVQDRQISNCIDEIRNLMDVPRQIRDAISCAKNTRFSELVTPSLSHEIDPVQIPPTIRTLSLAV